MRDRNAACPSNRGVEEVLGETNKQIKKNK